MDVNWNDIRHDWESGLSFNELSEKYGIAVGTIKSRRSREKWSRKKKSGLQPSSKEVATPPHEVATSDDENSRKLHVVYKYDWDELERKFITGNTSNLRKFSEQHKVNYETLRKESSARKWKYKRAQYKNNLRTKAIEKTKEKASEKIAQVAVKNAETLVEIASERNETHLELSERLQLAMEEAVGELRKYAVKKTTKKKTEQKKTIKPPKKSKKKLDKKDKSDKKVIDMAEYQNDKEDEPIIETEVKIIDETYEEEIKETESIIDVSRVEKLARALEKLQLVDRTALGMDDPAMQPKEPTSAEKVRERPKTLKDLKRKELDQDRE